MMFAILEGSNIVENFSKKSLEEKKQWLRNFVKKHVKFILITTNISRDEWNTQLQTTAVKRELASKTNEALENCYLMVSENCKVSTAQVSIEDCLSFNRVNKLMKNGGNSKEIILKSSETTLKDLLCALTTSSHCDGDEEMLQALRYLGTILVSGHIFQYHRGVLVPTGKTENFSGTKDFLNPVQKFVFFCPEFHALFLCFHVFHTFASQFVIFDGFSFDSQRDYEYLVELRHPGSRSWVYFQNFFREFFLLCPDFRDQKYL